MKRINHFIKFINAINERPGMYGVNRVEEMGLVILGYKYAIFEKEENELLTQFMVEFREFVNHRYEHKDNFDWVKLIRLYSGSDSHTREMFADLFNQFIESKGYKD